jgi:hypothetical protein
MSNRRRVNEDCIMISLSPLLPNTHIYQSDTFFTFDKVEGVKEGCETDVHQEILATPEWARSEGE